MHIVYHGGVLRHQRIVRIKMHFTLGENHLKKMIE